MQLFPRDRFSIQTSRPLSAVIESLESHIDAPRLQWRRPRNHRPYAGTLSDAGFEIRRIIHYRNSFLPQIRGQFEAVHQGTVVHVTMDLHPVVAIFLLAWLALWYSGVIAVTLAEALAGSFRPEALLFLFAPLAMLTIFGAVFWYEAKRGRQELTQIIQGHALTTSVPGQHGWGRAGKWLAWVILTASTVVLAHQHLLTPEQSPFITPSESGLPSQAAPICTQNPSASPYCGFSQVQTLRDHPTARRLALSSDGSTLVSGGSDKAIKVWNLQTGTLEQTLQSDSGVVTALAIAPDGHTVVSGAGDNMVRIWDANKPNQYPQMLSGHTTHLLSLVKVTADSRTILSGGYGEANLWNAETGQLEATLPETGATEFQIGPITLHNSPPHFYLHDVSADGKKLLVETGSRLAIWNLETDKQIQLPHQWFTSITSAHLSPDAQTVVTTSYAQPNVHLKIWHPTTGELKANILVSSAREYMGYGDRLALTNDVVMVSTADGLKIWNLGTGELDAVLEQAPLYHLVVSADGQQLIGLSGDQFTNDNQIQVWRRS